MAYSSFEDLEIWRLGCDLVVDVYSAFKECRDWGLRNQITRAVISVPSNIAEGAERGSARDFIRFLHIAKGSLAEVRTQLHLAKRIVLLDHQQTKDLMTKSNRLSSMIHNLIKYQSTQVTEAKELPQQLLNPKS